jgi:hypothetical protein
MFDFAFAEDGSATAVGMSSNNGQQREGGGRRGGNAGGGASSTFCVRTGEMVSLTQLRTQACTVVRARARVRACVRVPLCLRCVYLRFC